MGGIIGRTVSANQFDFGPAIFGQGGAVEQGINLGEQFRLQQLQRQQQEFLEGGGLESQTALQDAGEISLSFQQDVANSLGLLDKRTGQIDQARLNEAADFAFRIQRLPIDRQNIEISKRIERLESEERDATQTRELLSLPIDKRLEGLQGVQLAALPNEKRLEIIQSGDRSKIQFGGQETFKDTAGNIFFATSRRDPGTGNVEAVLTPLIEGTQQQGKLSPVSGAGVTPTEKVTQAGQIQQIKLRETRLSDITKELSSRNRDAARNQVNIAQALTLAQKASQGLTGSAKIKLAKLVPGIDVTDEAALEASLLRLSLDQLQAFKGPTTDFEFGVTQSITGGIGQSKESNIARLNSLKRSAWFNRREFEQFRKFTKAGGDPDDFSFDFNETIKTKRGDISLQDIQDTAVENNLTIEEVIRRLNL